MDEISPPLIILTSAVLVGAAMAWVAIGSRIARRTPVLDYEPRTPVPWTWIDLLLTLLVVLVSHAICIKAALVTVGFEGSISEAAEDSTGHLAVLGGAAIGSIVTFLVSAVLIAGRSGANLRDFGVVFSTIPRDTLYGFAAFLAAAPIVFLIQFLFVYVVKIEYDHELIDAFQKNRDAESVAILLFAAVVAAPLAEEFFFRVLLQGWLEKLETNALERERHWIANAAPESIDSDFGLVGESSAKGDVISASTTGLAGLPRGSVPILGSSLLFALVHFGQGAAPVPLFLYALVMGYLYYKTHRIMPSLVAHFALNATSMVVLLLSPMPS